MKNKIKLPFNNHSDLNNNKLKHFANNGNVNNLINKYHTHSLILSAIFLISFFILVPALFPLTSSYAKKPTLFLAPGYQNTNLNIEKAIIPINFATNEFNQNERKLVQIKSKLDLKESIYCDAWIAIPIKTEEQNITNMISYLKNSEVAIDSIKLRHIARMKKLELIKESNDNDYYNYYKNYVMTPILIYPFGSGGCAMGRTPSYIGYNTNLQYFFNSCIKITDGAAKVSDRIQNDTLCLSFAHENAHAIMFDIYLKSLQTKCKRISTNGHDGPTISDQKLAYTEGWAEAFEAIYGQMNPLLIKESEREKYAIAEFQFTRQDPVRRNRYIWQNYKGKKSGILKNGLQIISTEGSIAATFFDIMTSRKIADPFVKSITVMYKYKPANFIEFINRWAEEFNNDKQTLYRIFLEETKYVTMSNEARKLYYDYYQAGIQFKQGKIDKQKAIIARNKWLAYKEELFKKAMAGERIDANVGPDLWLNLKIPVENDAANEYNINMSLFEADSDSIEIFKAAGISEQDVISFIQAREAMGILPYKTASETLKSTFGPEKAAALMTMYNATDLN